MDIVHVIHILPLETPPSTAVDNGRNRNCQFLGFADISKFFGRTREGYAFTCVSDSVHKGDRDGKGRREEGKP